MRNTSHPVWITIGLLALSGCAALPVTAREPRANSKLEASLGVARVCETQGDAAKARQLYVKIAERYPKCADAHHRLGVMAGKDGNLDEATAHLNQAAQLKPNDSEILTDRSYVHYLAARFDEAESDARAALQASPKNNRAQVNLALTLGSKGEMDEAFSSFKAAVGESEAASNIGYLYAQRGDLENAKRWFTRAIEANRENRKAAEGLVQLHKAEQELIVARKTKSKATPTRSTPTKTTPVGTAEVGDLIQASAEVPAPAPRKLPKTAK